MFERFCIPKVNSDLSVDLRYVCLRQRQLFGGKASNNNAEVNGSSFHIKPLNATKGATYANYDQQRRQLFSEMLICHGYTVSIYQMFGPFLFDCFSMSPYPIPDLISIHINLLNYLNLTE